MDRVKWYVDTRLGYLMCAACAVATGVWETWRAVRNDDATFDDDTCDRCGRIVR